MIDGLDVNGLFDDFFKERPTDTFPPYNLYESETGIVLELAVAGYTRDRISVVYDQKNHVLSVSAVAMLPSAVSKLKPLRKKIADRAFLRKFLTDGQHEVASAELKDGLLTITLTKKVDLNKEPIKILIS